MQLVPLSAALLVLTGASALARADDKADVSTTWYQENRRGHLGGLTVVTPAIDLGVDAGDHVSLGAGYTADVVSGATSSVFSVDAVSSATKFSDSRHEGHADLGFHGARSQLNLSSSASVERDYTSLSFGGDGQVDLPGKNTTFGLSYSHNFDQACDRDNSMVASSLERRALTGADPCKKDVVRGVDLPGMTVWHDLSLDTAQATLTQNVSPTLVVQLGLFGQVLKGFQSNPYRRVRVSGVEAQETEPDVRGRLALFVQANKFLPGIKAAMHAMVRGYVDTWGVRSGTIEMAYNQYAGDSLMFRVRARIYQQSEATFFKDAFFYDTEGPAGAYFSGDRELAPIRNVVVGGKLAYLKVNQDGGNVWGVFDEVELDLKGDVLFLDELPANSLALNRAGVDGQFLSSGQLVDGFVLGLGLQTRY